MTTSCRWPSARKARTRVAAKLTGWKIGIESTEAHAKKVAAEGK